MFKTNGQPTLGFQLQMQTFRKQIFNGYNNKNACAIFSRCWCFCLKILLQEALSVSERHNDLFKFCYCLSLLIFGKMQQFHESVLLFRIKVILFKPSLK